MKLRIQSLFIPLINITFSPFRDKVGDTEVTVAVTQNGYADAVYQDKFVMPEERTMTVNQFLDILEDPFHGKGVFYIQKQNPNLTDEFATLLEDMEANVAWASEALGEAKCPKFYARNLFSLCKGTGLFRF